VVLFRPDLATTAAAFLEKNGCSWPVPHVVSPVSSRILLAGRLPAHFLILIKPLHLETSDSAFSGSRTIDWKFRGQGDFVYLNYVQRAEI
jgi:hypothetical protein